MKLPQALATVLVCIATSGYAADPEPSEPAEDSPSDLRGPASTGPEPPADPGPLLVKISAGSPKKSPWGEVLVNLTRRLALDSKDAGGKPRLALRIDWQANERRAVTACEGGKVAGIAVSYGALSASVSELAVIELPYLFDGYAKVDRALNGARSLITELLRDKGFVYVMRGENGFRNWASKTGFLTTPADFQGRPMRMHVTSVGRSIALALGAVPKAFETDVPARLASGEVDGYESPLLFARQAQWSQEITFVTLSRHAYDGAVFVWCKPWLDTLAPELQVLLTRKNAGMDALEARQLELARRFNDELMPRQYDRAGKRMRELTPAEREAMKVALAQIEAAFVAAASPKVLALLALLRK